MELPPLSGLEDFAVDLEETEVTEGGTVAKVNLVQKTPELVDDTQPDESTAGEKPSGDESATPAVAGIEKTESPASDETTAADSPLQRNIILLGIAGLALLAGMTFLVRKKQ